MTSVGILILFEANSNLTTRCIKIYAATDLYTERMSNHRISFPLRLNNKQ